jgi:hypothetical protein
VFRTLLALVTFALVAPAPALACGMRHVRPVALADLMDEVDAPAEPTAEAQAEAPAPAVPVAPVQVVAPKTPVAPTAPAPARPTAKVPNT